MSMGINDVIPIMISKRVMNQTGLSPPLLNTLLETLAALPVDILLTSTTFYFIFLENEIIFTSNRNVLQAQSIHTGKLMICKELYVIGCRQIEHWNLKTLVDIRFPPPHPGKGALRKLFSYRRL